jgi:hypothetical protein
VHDRVALQPVALAPLILEEARRWARAEFTGIASLGRLRSCPVVVFNFHDLVPNSLFLMKNVLCTS